MNKTNITNKFEGKDYNFLLDIEHYCTMMIRSIFYGWRNIDEMRECDVEAKEYRRYINSVIDSTDRIKRWNIKTLLDDKIDILAFGQQNKNLFRKGTLL